MAKLHEKKRRAVRVWPYILLAAVPAAFIAVFYILSGDRSAMDAVTDGFSAPVRGFIGDLCEIIQVSVMEVLYVLFGLWLIFFIVRTAVLIIKRKNKLRLLLKRIFALILVFMYIWTGYCWLWNGGYYASGFSDKSGLDSDGITTEDLIAVTTLFAEKAGELSSQVTRDESGHFAEEYSAYSGRIFDLYDNIVLEFPCLDGATRTPKAMFFSNIMSRMGYTGIYFPFTGETNINIDAPGCLIPATLAHEAAHQRGVQSESEANFAAVAACITSDDTVYQYSGYLLGLINLMNALYKASPDDWYSIYKSLNGNVLTDWQDNNAYWSSMETKVTKVSAAVYDTYLKANSQELGIKSYGACVDLLVTWIADK